MSPDGVGDWAGCVHWAFLGYKLILSNHDQHSVDRIATSTAVSNFFSIATFYTIVINTVTL